jgi:hypothetical protein
MPDVNYIRPVRRRLNNLGLLSFIVLGGSSIIVNGSEAEPGYNLIPKKNVFKLKEPPTAPPPQITNAPLSKVYLTGISTVLNQRLAFLRLPAAASKGAGPRAEESMMLAEGQRQGDIEVLEINEATGHVKIKQAGEIVDLSFEKDGVKSNLPAIAGNQPSPSENPAATTAAQPATQNPGIMPPPMATQPNLLSRRMLPTRNLSTTPPPLPTAAQPTAPVPAASPNQLTPQEEQQLLNEVEKLKTKPY